MRIVITGAGTMGTYLAAELSSEGHNIYLIDKNPDRIAEAIERMDVMAVEGEALDSHTITEANLAGADMLLAVTDSDEQNIVIAGLAREYGVGLVAARVRGEFYNLDEAKSLLQNRLRIDEVINPDDAAVRHMYSLLAIPGSLEVYSLAGGKAFLATFPVHGNCPIVDNTLSEVKGTPFDDSFPLAAALYRNGEIEVPRGHTKLIKNDEVSFIMLRSHAAAFGEWFVPDARAAHKVLILGAQSIGIKMARKLEQSGIEVTMVDPVQKRCLAASEALEKTRILRGKISEKEIASDLDTAATDYVIAATEDEEENLISAFLAKEWGVKRTMVVTQRPEYVPVLKRLRVDSVVNPRILAAGEVLRFIRKGIVLAVAKIGEDRPGNAEILEFMVSQSSPVAGKALKDAKLPQGTLLELLIEGETPVVPHGDTEIKPGMRALVFAVQKSLRSIQKMFAPE
ncbi:MAG: Trk system potassium transporter TrkA [Planctomycetes bacterium]|nr:Trk system potassium transporter TrkA [Planctomycetota bacterium]